MQLFIPSRGSRFVRKVEVHINDTFVPTGEFPSPRGEVGLERACGDIDKRTSVCVSIPSRGSWFGKSSHLEALLHKGLNPPDRHTSQRLQLFRAIFTIFVAWKQCYICYRHSSTILLGFQGSGEVCKWPPHLCLTYTILLDFSITYTVFYIHLHNFPVAKTAPKIAVVS